MINRVILVGRLTADPEVMTSKSGTAYCRFSIAVNSIGEEKANFFNCVAFNKTAENMARFVSKGSQIGVDGSLSQSTYERKDGTKASSVDIRCSSVAFLDSKGSRGGASASAPRATSTSSKTVSLSGVNQETYGSESISFDPDPEPTSSGISYDDIPWGE